MVKKLLILFPILIVLCLFLFNVNATNAQVLQNSINPHSLPLNTTPDVPQNLHTYTQASFIEILASAVCAISGVDPISPNGKCLGIDLESKKLTYAQSSGGLASTVGGLIASTFNIPISSTQYGHYLASNFGITRPTFAQTAEQICGDLPPEMQGQCISERSKTGFGRGVGFAGLTPILEIWKTFRNLTYLVFVLVFIVLGLGIMFRLNIDARTVMTIQNQIPKIIIALVLITFSYAIAGFLIDMMYVVIYLAIHIFEAEHLITLTNIGTNPFSALSGTKGISEIAAPAAQGVSGMIGTLFDGTIGGFIEKFIGGLIGGVIGKTVGGVINPLAGSIFGGLIGGVVGIAAADKIVNFLTLAIAYLVISLAILQSLFKVWWMLIKAYVFIFFDVLFAPFWILGGIIPGTSGGIGPWLRSLISNLAAFPTVIILFMIGRSIQEQAGKLASGNFVPPLIGDPGADSGKAIGSIIGLGIILIMPEAVTITKSALKAPELKYTTAIGQAIGVGKGVISKPFSGIGHEMFGKDIMGAPKPGSQWLTKKLGNSRLAQVIAGGGLKDNTEDHSQSILPSKISRFIPGNKRREDAKKAAATAAKQRRIDEAREKLEIERLAKIPLGQDAPATITDTDTTEDPTAQ